jgi:hypothetical protein
MSLSRLAVARQTRQTRQPGIPAVVGRGPGIPGATTSHSRSNGILSIPRLHGYPCTGTAGMGIRCQKKAARDLAGARTLAKSVTRNGTENGTQHGRGQPMRLP